MRRGTLTWVACVAAVLGCARREARIVVVNAGAQEIRRVCVHLASDSTCASGVAVGDSAALVLPVDGDASYSLRVHRDASALEVADVYVTHGLVVRDRFVVLRDSVSVERAAH